VTAAAMVDVSRVQKELTECNRDREVSGVSIALHDGANISHLTGTIAGPADSPYEGGTFVIDIPPRHPPTHPSASPSCEWNCIFHSPPGDSWVSG
jgi:ubiquitin-conjugating enzyme (huntingtin interacting protein 2)